MRACVCVWCGVCVCVCVWCVCVCVCVVLTCATYLHVPLNRQLLTWSPSKALLQRPRSKRGRGVCPQSWWMCRMSEPRNPLVSSVCSHLEWQHISKLSCSFYSLKKFSLIFLKTFLMYSSFNKTLGSALDPRANGTWCKLTD